MTVYLPKHFELNDPDELAAVIAARPLATLTGVADGEPLVDHAPLLLRRDGDRTTLVGHFARANPFARRVAPGTRVVAVFHGPDAYVSPSAYPSKQRDPRVVPTWNYVVVHATGRIRWFDDVASLRELVTHLTDHHETAHGSGWRVHDAPDDYVAKLFRGIVGFEIAVETLVGKAKASQNRSREDRDGVRARLAAGGLAASGVAALVREPTHD